MRYRFIDEHKKVWPVTLMCGVLSVSRSGYYHWSTRVLSLRRLANVVLDRQIREIFTTHRQRYGTPVSPRPYTRRASCAVGTAWLDAWGSWA
jgi:putative transposase